MYFDFSSILFAATLACGLIALMDMLFWRKPRIKRELEGSKEQEPVLVEYARSFFPVLLLVLILRAFVVEPFRIPSGSMEPTLNTGDFILVNKYTYGLKWPVTHRTFWPVSRNTASPSPSRCWMFTVVITEMPARKTCRTSS